MKSEPSALSKTDHFFQTLYAHCHGKINVRVIDKDKPTLSENHRVDKFATVHVLERHRERSIYFGVATRNGGGKKEDIVHIPALWVDIDFKDTPEEEAVPLLQGFSLKPSALVNSGGGYHCYWNLKEPLEKNDIAAVESMLKRLAVHFKGDMAATDASRILRVPGSFNQKYDPPRSVTIFSLQEGNRYTLDDFDDILPDAPQAATVTKTDYTKNDQAEKLMTCFFMQWCRDHAAELPEPLWFAMVSNAAGLSPGGPALVHELSRGYQKYSRQETDAKILHSINGSAPITCLKIRELGFDCGRSCGVKSPAGLVWRRDSMAEAPLNEPAPGNPPANNIQIINAAHWLTTEPPIPDQILEGIFDAGDKFALIGSSKLRKSFFLLMLAISLAAGVNFLEWVVPKRRRVLLVQLEIKEHHFHRRVRRMANAMGITTDDLEDRLRVINARGLGINGPGGIDRIKTAVEDFRPEVIVFDPLYKITTGVENAAEDTKIILNCFDRLAEQTGAAVGFVHHDPKGSPGDRDIRDRGAGSNVLGRDYDAGITLTAHAQNPDSAVVEILLRNYRPQEPFAVTWTENEDGGYRFEVSPDVVPDKKTSRTKAIPPPLATYLPAAESILGDGEMEIASFKASFKTKTGLSDHRIRGFIAWATSGGSPRITARENRGFRKHEKWLRVGRAHSNAK